MYMCIVLQVRIQILILGFKGLGQINLTSLLLIMGITIHFWSENILKVFISGQSGMSSGNSMTMCFVVSVNIGSRDASDRHCMTNPESLF